MIRYWIDGDEPIDRSMLVGLSPTEVAELVLDRQSPIEEKALASHAGFTGEDDIELVAGPFVVAELTADVVSALCEQPEVLFIGPYKEPEVEDDFVLIPDSLPTTKTERVHAQGFLGEGQTIAVLEAGGQSTVPPDGCLNLVERQEQTGADDHISQVMAIIGNRWIHDDPFPRCDGDWQGYAPKAGILAANAEYPSPHPVTEDINNFIGAFQWATHPDRAAQIISMSFHNPSEEETGVFSSRDYFFDYMVMQYPVSVFTSAGNEGHLDDGISTFKYSAGKGYNFIGVADVTNDANLGRCRAVIFPESTFRNPHSLHGDRETPEIAMPSSRYRFRTDEDDSFDFGGTSAATPAAAGVAALLLERNDDLRIWPEAIRAILLATADYELADDQRWNPGPEFEGHDGAGLVNSWLAFQAAAPEGENPGPKASGHDYGMFKSPRFLPLSQYSETPSILPELPPQLSQKMGDLGAPPSHLRIFEEIWTVQVEVGLADRARRWITDRGIRLSTGYPRVRAALTWGSVINSIHGPSSLGADIDLLALDPTGAIVAWSITYDNNYEILEFEPEESGEYTIIAFGYGMPPNWETYFGVAWTTARGCPG